MGEEMVEKKEKRKKTKEKPAETVKPKPPKPRPEAELAPPALPPKPEPVMSIAEKIYEYLKKHGIASPLKIARDLDLNHSTVIKTLKELEKQGKIQLQSIDLIHKYRMERALEQAKKRARASKKPFDLT